jgi:hypothetical protein
MTLNTQQLEQLKQTQRLPLQQHLNLKYRPQLQPLSVSQLQNTQQQKLREAQAARQRISQRKSVLMEDDFEFCPNSNDPMMAKRGGVIGNIHIGGSMSPYSTPVKMNPRMGQQAGYMSPQMMSSPQQMYHQASPQGILRRPDISNNSPMYINNGSGRW